MATTDRFEIIAPLPSSAGFRRALAVDRAGAPRAVVLAFAPARVADDPIRIAALARDAEAAARVRHPNVVPVDGLETVGGAIAVVEPHRPGASLRDLLDAGGRLPPDVAARVVADACAGLARVHALDPGDGRPLAHGAITAERLVLGEDGATVLCGLGAGLGDEPAADVRALAAVLHECLVGEPPAAPARPLDAPGLPPALAAVVDLALGATGGQPLRSAAVLGEAVAAALPLATREAVASYVEAILPAAEGERAALTRLVARATGEDVQEDLAVELVEEETATETATPVPTGSPSAVHPERSASALAEARSRGTTPTPTATPSAIPDPTGSPSAVHPERSATATAEAVSRGTAVIPSEPPSDRAVVRAEPIVIPARRTPAPPPPAEPLAMMHGAGDAPPAAPARSPDSVSVFPAPTPAARRRSRAPLAIAAACALIGFGAGFAATRGRLLPDLGRDEVAQRQPAPTAEPRPAEAAAPEVAVTASPAEDVRAAEAVDAVEAPPAPAKRAKPAQRKPPATRVAAAPSGGKGFLVVTAPAEAEVLLDGRRIGKGDVRREVDVGAHRVEVRLGEARVMEQFTLVRGETWTYDVTPTGN